jgi:hypothetical protein
LHRSTRGFLLSFAVPLFAAAAVVGYLAGHHRHEASANSSSGAPSAKAGIASVGDVLLEYPAAWRRAAVGPSITGLELEHRVLLAPGGSAQQAGLIGGVLPAGEASPIPSGLLSGLKDLPRTEVVGFPAGQAYRYDLMGLPGYRGSVELFVVPGQVNAGDTVLACYASGGFEGEQRQCSQIVAGLSLSGQSQYDLTPDVAYAHSLRAVMELLDHERLVLRHELAHASSQSAVAQMASVLASRFSVAASALAALETPAVAQSVEHALVVSLLQAQNAYKTLVVASDSSRSSAYRDASAGVEKAESAVDGALESFALLGYSQS